MAKQDLSKQFPDLHYLSIESVGKLLRSGAVSVTALTQYMLARIDSLDKRLCAYSTVLYDRALNAAATMDAAFAAGQDFGPLHGIPVAVKDLCCMAGIATTGGIKARQDYRPVEDATVVKKLEAAGAIILGKLNQTEGALMGYQEDFSIPINPWGKEYWPGFSSSGTGVAVAAGLCYAGIGTDTGGSIRLPAMANGVVGLKPSYGRVSRAGTLDLAASMDHIGPLTRCSRDAALTLQAIAGVDPRDSSTLDAPISLFSARNQSRLDGIRIGYDPKFTRLETEPEVVTAIEAAMTTLATLGAKVIPVEAPTVPADIILTWMSLAAHEAIEHHKEFYPSQAAHYGAAFAEFLALGASLTSEQVAQANLLRRKITQSWEVHLSDLDAFACPVGGYILPLTVSQYDGIETISKMLAPLKAQFTIPASFSGLPTLTLPCGAPPTKGLPYAMQLYGNCLGEQLLCEIGDAYENTTNWHKRHPPC